MLKRWRRPKPGPGPASGPAAGRAAGAGTSSQEGAPGGGARDSGAQPSGPLAGKVAGKLSGRVVPGKSPTPTEARAEEALGAGITLWGALATQGALRLDGAVQGTVRAGTVTVGPEGVVEGDLYAERAEIHGTVVGRVFAPTVVIEASGQVEGRIFHHKLTVVEGAYVNGPMPWRPMNYFEELAREAEGGEHEHV